MEGYALAVIPEINPEIEEIVCAKSKAIDNGDQHSQCQTVWDVAEHDLSKC